MSLVPQKLNQNQWALLAALPSHHHMEVEVEVIVFVEHHLQLHLLWGICSRSLIQGGYSNNNLVTQIQVYNNSHNLATLIQDRFPNIRWLILETSLGVAIALVSHLPILECKRHISLVTAWEVYKVKHY